MEEMFHSALSFTGDISKWDVSRVTSMYGMFYHASSFNSDVSKWDVSKVTDMQSMFSKASSFAQTLCGAWSDSAADKAGMFDGSPGRLCTTTTTTTSTIGTSAPRLKYHHLSKISDSDLSLTLTLTDGNATTKPF